LIENSLGLNLVLNKITNWKMDFNCDNLRHKKGGAHWAHHTLYSIQTKLTIIEDIVMPLV
jgi:hypothetical protein